MKDMQFNDIDNVVLYTFIWRFVLSAGTWILLSTSWLGWITGWITWCVTFRKWPCASMWMELFRYMCNLQYPGWLNFCRICRLCIPVIHEFTSSTNEDLDLVICKTVNNYQSFYKNWPPFIYDKSKHWVCQFKTNLHLPFLFS